MERPSHYLILLLGLPGISMAQTNPYKATIYHAYISNSMGEWKTTITRMENVRNKTDGFMQELVNYQYGYIAWCIGNEKEDEAEKYLSLAERNIQVLEERSVSGSYINAYKAAFYGFRMGLNPIKAPFYGPKSIQCARQSIEQDPSNPYGYIQYANSEYYMPAVFGGSKNKAIAYYTKAEMLMEQDKQMIEQDWNYLSLLTTIGKALEETNDLKAARDYYEKILKIEPGYEWVRDELYPGLLGKLDK